MNVREGDVGGTSTCLSVTALISLVDWLLVFVADVTNLFSRHDRGWISSYKSLTRLTVVSPGVLGSARYEPVLHPGWLQKLHIFCV